MVEADGTAVDTQRTPPAVVEQPASQQRTVVYLQTSTVTVEKLLSLPAVPVVKTGVSPDVPDMAAVCRADLTHPEQERRRVVIHSVRVKTEASMMPAAAEAAGMAVEAQRRQVAVPDILVIPV